MRVLITGAGGTVGAALSEALAARGDSVIGVTRDPAAPRDDAITWVAWDGVKAAVAEADAVVHLAGADVTAKRWTAARKAELRASRIDTARTLVEAIASSERKPRVLVSASAVGYYGPHGSEELDEDAPPGTDFLATLCRDWEAAAQGSGVRTVLFRMGVVLTREGGALPKMLRPFRLGLGGSIGRGRQWLSWVHFTDVTGAMIHAIDSDTVEGPLNLCAPEPLTNAAFTRALGGALRRPALLWVPPFVFRLQLGEGASVLTSGQRVLPRRTEALGYRFRFRDIDAALADLLR